MERLLVTGIDFPLGCNLALHLAERAEVFGLYSQQAVASSELQTARWEPGDARAMAELVDRWQPQWILHCGPLSTPSWDLAPSTAVGEREVQVVAQWAAIADKHNARLAVISSDAAFSGPRMFHEENSPATNPSPRAAQIRAMERALEPTSALIVRTHAYGWSPIAAHAGHAEQAFEALSAGLPIEADGRRHATPILATDLAELLARAFEMRLQGVYHLSGAERASQFRWVRDLATAADLHLATARVDSTSLSDCSLLDETSLNSKRCRRALERATPLLREGLEHFAQQATNGWRERCRALGRPAAHQLAA